MTTIKTNEILMRSIIDSISLLEVFAIHFIPSPSREYFLTKIKILTEWAITNFKYPNEGSFFVLDVLDEDLKLQAHFAQNIIDAAKIHAVQPTTPNATQSCDVVTSKDVESLGDKIIAAVSKAAETAEGKTAVLKQDNAALLKANQATSEEFQEAIRQFVNELQYPQSLIYDLRWNRHLSQAQIVSECSQQKIAGCRTKKRVGELLAEIIGKAKAKGYRLSDRITGPGASPDLPTGYDEATDGKTITDNKTPYDNMTADEMEMDIRIKEYYEVVPYKQALMRERYGPEFVNELNRRALMDKKNRKPNRTS